MRINSIGAYKLSAIVSRISKKGRRFISKLFLSLQQQFIVLFDDIHFGSIFLKVKGMRTVQVFFEDCVASS